MPWRAACGAAAHVELPSRARSVACRLRNGSRTADDEVRANLRGIAFSVAGDAYAWYSNGKVSAGTPTDLETVRDLADFALPSGNCSVTSAIHEIGHAIGLQHEQRRPDRDDHVRVFDDLIESTKRHNFDKGDANVEKLGAYDITSRMHYESYGFSITGQPTMLALRPAGESVPAADVVDMAINSKGEVFTWWSDQTVTVGHSDDLEATSSRYHYELPNGHQVSDIVGIGFAPNTGKVYTWLKNKRRVVGTAYNLNADHDAQDYKLPYAYDATRDYQVGDVLAIDIAPSGRVYTWYRNGKVSIGISTDLFEYATPVSFSLAGNKQVDDVLGMAIAPSGSCYAWYTSGSASAGTSTDFAADRPLYDFVSRLDELSSSPFLTAGDLAAVKAIYD